MIDDIQKRLLKEVADLDSLPVGAYNIRANGAAAGRHTTANIDIVTKTDRPGIDIIIAPGTKNESVHIPVVVSQTGLKDLVYNDFYIGENADVVIIAGCGIHCAGAEETSHDGIHTFHVGKKRPPVLCGKALRRGRGARQAGDEPHHHRASGGGRCHGDGDHPDLRY